MWNVLLWNALCPIPIGTDMAKKNLLGRRYQEHLFMYSRFFGISIQCVIFLGCIVLESTQIYSIFSCRTLIISYKILIITGISNETSNQLTIYAIFCGNVTIFYQQELASLRQVQENLKAYKKALIWFSCLGARFQVGEGIKVPSNCPAQSKTRQNYARSLKFGT